VKPTDALGDVRRSLHERLIGRVDARQLDAMPRAERRLRVREEALSLLREQGHMLAQNALADVVNAVSDAVVGMGPIEFLLKDPEVTEVMVNGPDDVYVERKGRIERVADRLFEGEEAVLHPMERNRGTAGSPGRRDVTLGGRATSGRLSGADPISLRLFRVGRPPLGRAPYSRTR
jgi:pilus assembly protein CpaF